MHIVIKVWLGSIGNVKNLFVMECVQLKLDMEYCIPAFPSSDLSREYHAIEQSVVSSLKVRKSRRIAAITKVKIICHSFM